MSRDRAICWDEHSRNQRIRHVIMPSTSAKGHCLGFPLLWGGRGDSGRHKDCESMESGQSSSQDRAKQGARRAWTGIFDCCERGSGTEVSTQAIHGELIPGKPCSPCSSAHHTQHFPFMGMGCGMVSLDTRLRHLLEGCGAVEQPLVQNFPPTLRRDQS